MSFSMISLTSFNWTLVYKVSSGKTLTNGPWEQRPKQETMFAVTLSSKLFSLIKAWNLSNNSWEPLAKQPVSPQRTISLWPY